LKKRDPFYIRRMDKTKGKIIVDGNSAAAMDACCGCTVVTWYPITPSSSLVETMIDYMKEYRVGPDARRLLPLCKPRRTGGDCMVIGRRGRVRAR